MCPALQNTLVKSIVVERPHHPSGTPGDGQWLTGKDSSQSRKHGMTLLTHRREITANATISRRSVLTAKGSCYLLLDFDHPQIPLSLVIGKRDPEIVQKGQHLVGPPQQVIEQILGGTLPAPPASLGNVFG